MTTFYLRGRQALMLVCATLALNLAACSSTPKGSETADVETTGDPRDPLESINRPIWTFNWEYADKYFLKPASKAYTGYTPQFLRSGLLNMAENLDEPSSAVNNLLQGKFSDAGQATGRFVLNSTVGLLGFFDPASDFGWQRREEEFGEVLGHYGVGDGPYIMLPALGPSSARDEVGDFVDRYYWPLAVIDFWPNIARNLVIALETREQLSSQEQLINQSLDSYEFVKNAYFQNVAFRVYDGNPPVEVNDEEEAELDEYLDEFDDL